MLGMYTACCLPAFDPFSRTLLTFSDGFLFYTRTSPKIIEVLIPPSNEHYGRFNSCL